MIQYAGLWLNEPLAAVAQVAAQIPAERAFDFSRWPALSNPDLNPRIDLQWFLSRGVRLGCYFNPWGASRFGYAHVVVDQTMLNKIRQQAYPGTGYQSLPFTVADNVGGTITTNLWMLPAVPLAAVDDGKTNFNAYLLPLVDDRFFWWETSSDELIINEGTTTWSEWYGQLADALGITLNADPVSGGYLYPSAGLAQQVRLPFPQGAVFGQGPQNFTGATTTNGPYNYLPLILDATAAACGQRIIRKLNGSYYALNASSGVSLVNSQAQNYPKIAGGALKLKLDANSNVPENVAVSFPMAVNGLPTSGKYQISKATGTTNGDTYLLESTAIAFLANETSGSPVNNGELDSLAEKAAADFATWRSVAYEARYASVVPWGADGIHDVEWNHAGTLATAIMRSAWTPNVGVLHHASVTTGSSDDWWPPPGYDIELIDGINYDGTFDAWLLWLDNDTQQWNEGIRVWGFATNSTVNPPENPSGNLTAGYISTATFNGYQAGGPMYMASENPGSTEPPASPWVELVNGLTVIPWMAIGAWSSTTSYNQNDEVTESGNVYIANVANADDDPASDDGTWTQLTAAYLEGVFVSYMGNTYLCLQDDDGSTVPGTDSAVWLLLPGPPGSPSVWSATPSSPYTKAVSVVQIARAVFAFDPSCCDNPPPPATPPATPPNTPPSEASGSESWPCGTDNQQYGAQTLEQTWTSPGGVVTFRVWGASTTYNPNLVGNVPTAGDVQVTAGAGGGGGYSEMTVNTTAGDVYSVYTGSYDGNTLLGATDAWITGPGGIVMARGGGVGGFVTLGNGSPAVLMQSATIPGGLGGAVGIGTIAFGGGNGGNSYVADDTWCGPSGGGCTCPNNLGFIGGGGGGGAGPSGPGQNGSDGNAALVLNCPGGCANIGGSGGGGGGGVGGAGASFLQSTFYGACTDDTSPCGLSGGLLGAAGNPPTGCGCGQALRMGAGGPGGMVTYYGSPPVLTSGIACPAGWCIDQGAGSPPPTTPPTGTGTSGINPKSGGGVTLVQTFLAREGGIG